MSSCPPTKPLSTSSSSSKGGRLSRERESRVSKWSEWQWHGQYCCEYRSRENPVGSGRWDFEYRETEGDDPTPRSSQLDLSSGPPDCNQRVSQEYTVASDTLGGYPNSDSTTRTATAAPFLRQEPTYDSSQVQSSLSVDYNLSLRPALDAYSTSHQGSTADPVVPSQLMTDSRGFPIGGSETESGIYAKVDDDNGWNYSPSSFQSPYQTSFTQNRPAARPKSPDARQRSDTNESDLRITSMDDIPGNESLDPNYKVHLGKDFKFARVFKILWTEPMGQGKGRKIKGTEIIPAKYGEDAYASIRRFIVVKALEGHCLCLPILTYGGQATKKKGVKPQDHAIVYMVHEAKREKDKPEKVERPREIDNEQRLTKTPIRIKPLTPRDQLDPLSRLNYAKIYTVEYNVKVCFIGSVHEDSQKYFRRDYNLVHKPLPEDPDTQYSDEEQELGVPQSARLYRVAEQKEPETRQGSRRLRDKGENNSGRKEKRDKHLRGKGSSRS